LGAVHASKITTSYHKSSVLGLLPANWSIRRFFSFKRAFFSNDWDSKAARVLLFLVIPGHIFFNWLIQLLQVGSSETPNSPLFTSFYLLAALFQVILILYICQLLVAFLWQKQIDPDNAAIPYLTAIGAGSGWSLIKKHKSEKIFGVQLAGGYADTMASAAQTIKERADIVNFTDSNGLAGGYADTMASAAQIIKERADIVNFTDSNGLESVNLQAPGAFMSVATPYNFDVDCAKVQFKDYHSVETHNNENILPVSPKHNEPCRFVLGDHFKTKGIVKDIGQKEYLVLSSNEDMLLCPETHLCKIRPVKDNN
uniref:MgtE domain-containing protein n=1 Tax=Rhabditophanes sp. KR3021 TaxID=114890 RepID=A0AC35UIQ2_9BILA